MEVSLQIDPLGQEPAHLAHDGLYRPRANAVLAIRHSVLKNVDRLLEPGKVFHGLAQALWVDLAVRNFNAGIALGLMWRNGYLEKQCSGTSALKPHAQPAVIIDPHKITSAFHLRQALAEFIQRKRRLAALDALGKIVIESPLNKAAQPAVHRRPRAARLENNIVLRPANVGILLQRMDSVISRRMRKTKISGDLRRFHDATFFPWRKFTQKIAEGD